MAAPSYTNDLTSINDGQSGTYVELTNAISGGTPQVNTTEWFIQGTGCVTAAMNNKTTLQSIAFNNGSGITIAAGEVILMWQVCLASNVMDTFANGGLRMAIGDQQGAYYSHKTGGSDFGRNPTGGWQNVAVDPTFTPKDYTEGSPSGVWQYFGSMLLPTGGVSKGEMHCTDEMSYGRAEIIIEFGDIGNGYGTFDGIATKNDLVANRWGLLKYDGGGMLWKGLMSFGNATNACDFRDSNQDISIDDTPRTYAAFNKIEINNASSRVDWTKIKFKALNDAQLSLGSFEMKDDATVNITGCQFVDMSTFIFDSNAIILESDFVRCAQITQALGVFTGCEFDSSTAAISMVVDNEELITDCKFISSGTGYAMEGFSAAGDYSLSDLTFTGYAATDGVTGNEAIHVLASSGIVNIAYSGGTKPTIHTAGATVNVTSSVPLTMKVQNEAKDPLQDVQTSIYLLNSPFTELMNEDTLATGLAEAAYTGTVPVDIVWKTRKSETTDNPRYIARSDTGQITALGFDQIVTMKENPILN